MLGVHKFRANILTTLRLRKRTSSEPIFVIFIHAIRGKELLISAQCSLGDDACVCWNKQFNFE